MKRKLPRTVIVLWSDKLTIAGLWPEFPGFEPGEPCCGIVDQRSRVRLGDGPERRSERALISVYASEYERRTAFGWYHLAVGLSAIPAGLLFGTLWHYWGAGAAFLFAGSLALACVLLLRLWGFAGKEG